MRTEVLKFPKSILIETCSLCQGKCLFCPYSSLRRGKEIEYLDIEVIKKILLELKENYVTRVTLFNNNEPLLDDRIFEITKLTRSILPDVEITLSTNGLLLTKEKIRKLYEGGLTFLYVSIPTLNEAAYEEIMGYKLGKLLEVLRSIYDTEYSNIIRIAVPLTNSYNVEEYDKEFKQNGITVCTWFMEYVNDWNLKTEFLLKYVNLNKYIGPCDRPLDQAVVQSNGNMILCCRDWLEDCVLGNVYNNSIQEIWSSEKAKLYQEKIKNQEYDEISLCKNCSLNINCFKRMLKL